jgi:two-component SAPR family response regulator
MRINIEKILCDMLEFDRLAELGSKAAADQRAVYLEKAEKLYQGPLFEDSYYPWAALIQSNYEYRYVELLNNLAEYHRKNGEGKKADYYADKMNEI